MKFSRISRAYSAVLAALVSSVVVVSAQTVAPQRVPPGREVTAESVARYALSDKLPVDPEVEIGTLPNGLRYYVRPNGKPAHRVELRLVVRAGSVLEDPDQLGLAHFLEHMLFEGTEHFPGNGIIQFLSSLGLGIGPDANAQTSYDQTEYILRLPTDSPDVIDRGLLVLEDWARAATFDEKAIERERGIVLSEWRLHLGAGERTQEKIRRIQLEGSRYASRTPIGDPDVIQRATREQLVRFYRDWYRPNLMAVIVVGDVDRDTIVGRIRAHFMGLTNPTPERPRPEFDVPDKPATRYAIVTDKEATGTVVELSNLRPARPQDTVGGYRQIMMDQLFGDMLDARLGELQQKENPPFLRVGAQRALFDTPRTKDEAVLQALVPNNGAARGLGVMIQELQRVIKYGFTPTELARAKQAMMLSYERSVTESPDRESASRADEYTRNFLESEALPTIWQELAFHRRFVPDISLAELNALSKDWFPEDNRLVILSGPEAAGVALPTAQDLAGAVTAAMNAKIDPYVDVEAGQMLMDAPPKSGAITKTTTHQDTGITEWTLSNGATVVLKPTRLKEDQVLFRAFAPGGTSVASDADFIPARSADDVIPAGGVGKFNPGALDRMLAGKAVAVTPFIGEIEEGMAGGSTPQDLETMFQLLYLRFTEPRADPVAFAALKSQMKGLLANRTASPEVVFNQTLNSALTGDHLRRQPETPESVDRWDLNKSLAFYKARFADASHFTFVFVGSFTPEMIKPLVETYVASLPATKTNETWRDIGVQLPRGVTEKTIRKGIAPKSTIAIVFNGPFMYDEQNVLALRAMTNVLEARLFDTIRQELGATYDISVDPDTEKRPKPEYMVRVFWTSDPARTPAIVQRVWDEIRFVRDTPLSTGQVARIRAAMQRQFEQDSQSNGYLLNQISRHYQDGDPQGASVIVDLPQRINRLTGEDIQRAARTYLDTGNYVSVVLMPEAQTP